MIRFAFWFWSIFLLSQFTVGCSLVDKQWMKDQQALEHQQDAAARAEVQAYMREHDVNMTKQHQLMMPEHATEVGVLGSSTAVKLDAIKADADAKIAETQKKLDAMATDDATIKWILGALGSIAGIFGISRFTPTKGSSDESKKAIADLAAKLPK